MTPQPTPDQMALRRVLSPDPGAMHTRTLVSMAKDGVHNKDILASHPVGMLYFGVKVGIIAAWEATLFQIPFTRGPKIRASAPVYGAPFIGPDSMIVCIDGASFRGGSEWYDIHEDPGNSPLLVADIQAHPLYDAWLSQTLLAGGDQFSSSYTRMGSLNDLASIDKMVNSRPYQPGPNTALPTTASTTMQKTPSKGTSKRKRAPSKAKGKPLSKKRARSSSPSDQASDAGATPSKPTKARPSSTPSIRLRLSTRNSPSLATPRAAGADKADPGTGGAGPASSRSPSSLSANPPKSHSKGKQRRAPKPKAPAKRKTPAKAKVTAKGRAPAKRAPTSKKRPPSAKGTPTTTSGSSSEAAAKGGNLGSASAIGTPSKFQQVLTEVAERADEAFLGEPGRSAGGTAETAE
ncbi:unnamed protein product [Sphagnum balticum]